MSAKVKKERSFRLSLKGRLTVDRAAELKKAFQDALSTGEAVDVDLSEATEVDITFLQLLHAAGKAAIQKGQAFVLPTTHLPAAAKALKAAGLCAHAGLCQYTDEPCLWTGGVE
jgi:anti-anti-sigma regulatory factor